MVTLFLDLPLGVKQISLSLSNILALFNSYETPQTLNLSNIVISA